MTADPSLFYDIGADRLPWKASTTGTPTVAPDQGRDVILALVSAALVAELGDSWAVDVVGTPLSGTTPVTDTLRLMPDADTMRQRKAGWPLLAVYRDPARKADSFTLSRVKLTGQIHVDWIIGPLSVGDTNLLSAYLERAVKTLVAVFTDGGHPAYRASTLGRALYVLGGDNPEDGGACFKSCWCSAMNAGQAAFATGTPDAPKFWAVSCTLDVEELTSINENAGVPIGGAQFNLGTGNDEGVIQDLVVAVTDETQQTPFGAPDPTLDP